jgi:hypothetical protein
MPKPDSKSVQRDLNVPASLNASCKVRDNFKQVSKIINMSTFFFFLNVTCTTLFKSVTCCTT